MGQNESSLELPLKIPFANGLIYIETDKPIYYPGQTIRGNVHLQVTQQIEEAKQIDIIVKGKETFNFKTIKRRDEESCRNYFIILDHQTTLCNFHKKTIAPGQYSFKFQIELPSEQLPASYIQRQEISGEGDMKAKIRYSLSAVLTRNNDDIIAKYSRRFYVAHAPIAPRNAINDQNTIRVSNKCCSLRVRGSNTIAVNIDRNYYTSDEVIKTKVKVDNSQSEAICTKVIVKLMKKIQLNGSNGKEFIYSKQVARAEALGLGPREVTVGFEREINLQIFDSNLKFDSLRDHKMRHFKPEDLRFASQIQPTTSGNCVECTYTLVITREFDGGFCNTSDVDGINIPLTINPGITQLQGFKRLAPPSGKWSPHYIDCEPLNIKIEMPLNRSVNPYERRRPYNRSDIEYVEDDDYLIQHGRNQLLLGALRR